MHPRLLRLVVLILLSSSCLAVLAQASAVLTSRVPGAELGARILAADRLLGSRCGQIVVDAPGALSTPFTLASCHSLRVNANVAWSAVGSQMLGAQEMSCRPGTRIDYSGPKDSSMLTTPPNPAGPVGNLQVGAGCRVVSVVPATLLSVPQRGEHVTVRQAELSNLVAIDACEASHDAAHDCADINLLDSTVTGGPYGVHFVFTRGARAERDRFIKLGGGAVYWGGNAETEYATIGRMRDITFADDTCEAVFSCTWGSMGVNVVMRGSVAHGCVDVCFDAEGSQQVLITNTEADRCGNGCGASFFNADGFTMTGNRWSAAAGGTLILIKNASRNPMSIRRLVIRGNTLTCRDTVCFALTYDAAQFEFSGNTVENGILQPTFMNGRTVLDGNHFHFARPVPAGAAVLSLAPVEMGQQGVITGNWVISDVLQPAGSMCIHAAWTDFNESDSYTITGNHCEGTAPFPIDLKTETAGQNPGPHATWTVAGNWWGSGNVLHSAGLGNEVYKEGDRYTRSGGMWVHTPAGK